MSGINALSDGLAPLRFGIVNEVSEVADAVNREVKTVQVHRVSHACRIDDLPMDSFTRLVSEMFGCRPGLAVDPEYGILAATRIVFFPFHDNQDVLVLP